MGGPGPTATSPLWGEVDFERSEKSGEGELREIQTGRVATKL
jgi:hypothetical protein